MKGQSLLLTDAQGGTSRVTVANVMQSNGVIHVAGQVGWDKNCGLAERDLAAQTRQALANIGVALAAVGCGVRDLLRLRTYVVDHDAEKLSIINGELAIFYGDVTPAPNTLIGVAALALPEFMVEIEASAVIPRR